MTDPPAAQTAPTETRVARHTGDLPDLPVAWISAEQTSSRSPRAGLAPDGPPRAKGVS